MSCRNTQVVLAALTEVFRDLQAIESHLADLRRSVPHDPTGCAHPLPEIEKIAVVAARLSETFHRVRKYLAGHPQRATAPSEHQQERVSAKSGLVSVQRDVVERS